MRILMTTDAIGGVWTFTRELSREFLENGCAVALVSVGRIPSPAQLDWVASQVSEWGSRFRFAASDAPLEWMQDNWSAMSEGEPLLNRIANEFQPDLLISSQFCFGAFNRQLPRIVVAHGDVLSWAQACRGVPLPSSDWLDRYIQLVSRGLDHANAVVAPTAWMLGALASNFHLPSEAHVIPNGRTIPSTWRNQNRVLQAVTAGHLWDEDKNLRVLADVESPIPILVAGETEREYEYVDQNFGRATLLGPLDEARLISLFQQSSIYICSSLYEPFGLAPLEAALCGCAVLANDIPSLREVWGDAALYFNNPPTLSAMLSTLAGDEDLLARARSRARRKAQQFSARKMAKSYLNLAYAVLQPAVTARYAA